jgi:hypothetical protein
LVVSHLCLLARVLAPTRRKRSVQYQPEMLR